MKTEPGEQFTIRQKILVIFGASFHIYDAQGAVVGFCRQKALRLKEDLRVYTGEDQTEELFAMKARSILDFGTTYDVTLPDGASAGSLRRKGIKSMFRDEWLILDPEGREVAIIREDSAGKAIARRVLGGLAAIFPQKFQVEPAAGSPVSGHQGDPLGQAAEAAAGHGPLATYRTHFNPFVYRLGVAIHRTTPDVDEMLLLAAACLVGAIEGRQTSGNSGSGFLSGN